MKLIDFDKALTKVTSLQAVMKLVRDYLGAYHIRAYAFTYYSGHVRTGRALKFHAVSPALEAWHTHYLQQGYADVDGTLQTAHLQIYPVYWNLKQQFVDSKTPREKQMRQESIDFGLDQGLSLPLHGPNNDFVTLTLHQRRGETCLSEMAELQYTWWSAAMLLYQHIKRILDQERSPDEAYSLTPREKQCLEFTAQSYNAAQIAKVLNISVRTVHFHLQNVNKKMGTHNKYLSILIASRMINLGSKRIDFNLQTQSHK